MAKRTGPVHVATTSRRYKGRLYQSHLLRRSFREDGKVKHETLGNLSHLPPDLIQMIRAVLAGTAFVPADQVMNIVRGLPHGHVVACLGSLRNLGLEKILDRSPSRKRDLAVAMIVSRILDPGSKFASAQHVSPETAISSLGSALDLGPVDEDELYRAMDWLVARQDRIERALSRRHLQNGTLILYDVSSSYYTGRHCSLVQFGHNRDGKKRFPQIVYGLLCNREGCPVAIEVFPGNTADPKTLGAQIEKVRARFGLEQLVLVGDRGTLTQARIRQDVQPAGLDWITALRAPAIQELAEQKIVQPSLFDTQHLAEVTSPDYPGERLVACFNPLLAAERARKREELLKATEKQLGKITEAVTHAKRRLRGKENIALRVGKVLGRFKMAKHFQLNIGEDAFTYARDEASICREATLDGIYVIRTSVSASFLSANEVVQSYKSLSWVERAFRSLKTVDLKIRPIHHRLSGRVRAHVFLCMLAYYVEWHMRKAWAPLLFDEEDRRAAATERVCAVAPAQLSKATKRKKSTGVTVHGFPPQSFQSLLGNLATIAKNTIQPSPGSKTPLPTFEMTTSPTPHQRKALELLSVTLQM